MTRRQRFAPRGALALDPQAFGLSFDVEQPVAAEQQAGVAVVSVRGPLLHHSSWCFDSYEAIRSRVAAALDAGPKAVVLRLDSPGGLVSGMIETARALRAMADDAEIPLVAYVDGSAVSAAYALACACDRIATSPTGMLGSIGILDTLTDATGQAEMFGLKHRLVTSGARKGDGHPVIPISDDAVTAVQSRVNDLAEVFFAHVAERRGVGVDDVRALEAGIATGAEAVRLGLADEVTTFDDLLASIASGTSIQPAAAGEDTTMSDKQDEARKALQAILDDDDADEKAKARARRAIKAMDDDDKDESESKAEGDDKKDEEARAQGGSQPEARAGSHVGAATATDLAALVNQQGQQLKALMKERENEQRTALLASRPDLDENLVKVLREKPLDDVKAIVAAIPKPKVPNPAAATVVPVTRGEGQTDGGSSRQAPDAALAMDRAMGLVATKPGVKREGTKLYLGVSVPQSATPASQTPAPTR